VHGFLAELCNAEVGVEKDNRNQRWTELVRGLISVSPGVRREGAKFFSPDLFVKCFYKRVEKKEPQFLKRFQNRVEKKEPLFVKRFKKCVEKTSHWLVPRSSPNVLSCLSLKHQPVISLMLLF